MIGKLKMEVVVGYYRYVERVQELFWVLMILL